MRRILFPLVGVMISISICMFLSLIIAIIYNDGNQHVFFNLTVFTVGITGILFIISGESRFKLSKYSWGVFIAIAINIYGITGALPYYFILGDITFINSWFESISGFTATGSTIFISPESLTPSLQFWRSLSQWIGSAFFILIACLLFPAMNIGGSNITGRNIIHQNRMYNNFYSVFSLPLFGIKVLLFYAIITALCIISFKVAGLTIWQSINLALTTVSHGGFINNSNSFIGIQQYSIIYTAIFFMVMASIPVGLTLFLCLINALKEQYKLFIAILSVSTLIIFAFFGIYDENIFRSFTNILFSVVSFITGTGFRITNYNYWPIYVLILLTCLTIIGGCSRTSNSGIKIFRLALAVKLLFRHLRLLVEPHRKLFITFNESYPKVNSLVNISSYLILFIFTTIFLIIILLFFNMNIIQAVGGILATITNFGPNIFDTTDVSNYYHYSSNAKFILGWSMILGRFEIIPILILFFKLAKNV